MDCIDYRILQKIGLPKRKTEQRSFPNMKATGMRIREGDPLLMTLARWERFCFAMGDLAKRQGWE